jgi:predicted DCC family thiol-disulfide oxidoreductase YuxK
MAEPSIVIFDGGCNVCNAYVRFLVKRDRRHRLIFVPAASDQGRAWLARCGEALDDPSTMIVVERGVARLRSDAVFAAVAELGGSWRAIRLLALMPRPLRDALYTGFARRRYRWFGRADACATCERGVRTKR